MYAHRMCCSGFTQMFRPWTAHGWTFTGVSPSLDFSNNKQFILSQNHSKISYFFNWCPICILKIYFFLKGALDNFNIIPTFFSPKIEISISPEAYAIMHVKWLHALSFTCNFNSVMKIWGFYFQRPFLKVDFNKYTIQQLMGHSEDDAVHKIHHKMKTHWQNQLKISVLV